MNPYKRGGKVAPHIHLYRGSMTLWLRFCISHTEFKNRSVTGAKFPWDDLVQGESDACPHLFIGAAVYPGMPKPDIKLELVTHLPDRTQ